MQSHAQLVARGSMTSVVNDVVESDVDHLLGLAVRGLRGMYVAPSQEFVQTVRGRPGPSGPRVVGEGRNLRYAAIAALGLHRSPRSVQREVLAGGTAVELSALVAQRARDSADPGAVALAAWAAAEIENRCDTVLFDRIRLLVHSRQSVPTVDVAWMLSAAVAAGFVGPTADVAHQARQLLLSHQGPLGLFPHALPSESLGRFRSHVGCFADQVYPMQALARFAARQCRRRRAGRREPVRGTDLRPAGRGRSVVVALRRPRRLRGRGLPGLQRAPARHGARWRSSTWSRPAARTTATPIARGAALAVHASRGARRAGRPSGSALIWRKVGRREPARRCAR